MVKKFVHKGWWTLVGLSLLAAGLSGCGDGGGERGLEPTAGVSNEVAVGTPGRVPPADQTPASPVALTPADFEAAMGLDAVAGGQIDVGRIVAGSAPFEVDVVVLDAGPGYQGYQFKVQWDPAVLAYDSQVELMPEDMDLCATPTLAENTMYTGCARVRDNTMFEGPVNTLSFHCVGQGTGTIHLLTPFEITAFGSTLMGFQGVTIPTEVRDASVTCGS